jgi:hypothetical protein
MRNQINHKVETENHYQAKFAYDQHTANITGERWVKD